MPPDIIFYPIINYRRIKMLRVCVRARASHGRHRLNLELKQTKLLKLNISIYVKNAKDQIISMNNLRHRLRDERGFNLIELMIVIAIIGLLIGVGSIAWQAVIRSGNETAAEQTIRRVSTLEAQYASKNRGKFAGFDELVRAVGLDDRFTGERPVVNGYIFSLVVQESSGSKPSFYSITADPQSPEGVTASGTRHFYTDSSLGTIKSTDENRPAKPDDPSM